MSIFSRKTAQSIGIDPGPDFKPPTMALETLDPEPAEAPCTRSHDCLAQLHLPECGYGPKLVEPERQTWERRVGGTDIADVRIHLEVDAEGRVRLHEALVARLLHEAGWERTA